MIDLAMLTAVVDVAGLGLGLWLSLHLARAPAGPAARLAGLSALLLALYFFLSVMLRGPIGAGMVLAWLRWMRLVVVLAPAVWFHLTWSLVPSGSPRPPLGRLVYIPAALLGSLGVLSDALIRSAGGPPLLLTARQPGPLYGLFAVYLLVLAAGALMNLWRRLRSVAGDTRSQAVWLLLASLLGGAGGLYLTLGTWARLPWPALPGEALLAGATLALAVAMIRHGALVHATTAAALPRELAALALVLSAYLVVTYISYWAFALPAVTFVLVVPLAVISHSLFHWLLGPPARALPASQGAPVPRDWVAGVEDGLRRIFDPSYLGQHPLAELHWVRQRAAGSTHLDRGRAVAALLREALARLRPPGTEDGRDRAWHGYLILHRTYVEGEGTREVMNDLFLSEATFHRYRRRAVESVARAILEMEEAARLLTG